MRKRLCRLLAAICAAAMMITGAVALTPEQARELLKGYYVDAISERVLQAADLESILTELGDTYTCYFTREEYQAFLSSVNGNYVGIGVAVSYSERGIYINEVLAGGTAEAAGLASGDTIIAVNGRSCVPATEVEVGWLSGEEGTEVNLTVLRADGTQQELRLTRRSFSVPTTAVDMVTDGVAYIQCVSFGDTTGTDFIQGIQGHDAETDMWVVDLRNNPGGLLDSAIQAAGAFTGEGYLLYLRDGEGYYYPYIYNEGSLTADPVIVLTNSETASAAEDFAIIIKEANAGIVVGSRSYGKGVAQIMLDETTNPELFDGDAIKITAYRGFSAHGNTVDKVGVYPTLIVDDAMVNDVALVLCTPVPTNAEGYARFGLGSWYFYVDADTLRSSEAGQAVLSELFAALAPDALVEVWAGGQWVKLDVPMAAAQLRVNYESRWFSDVSQSEFGKELNVLATYGVLRGTGNGTYLPENTLTRAQLCALLAQALNLSSQRSSVFTDVTDGRWYTPSIMAMYDMGLVQGKENGKFGPDDLLTQQELTVVLGRLAEFLNFNCYETVRAATEEDLAVEELNGWANWSRTYAWMMGLALKTVEDEPVNLLHDDLADLEPTAIVLREEAGATLYRILTCLGVLYY